jgi:phenylacetate-CoA ligase
MIRRPFEFWESERTIDYIYYPSVEREQRLKEYYLLNMQGVMQHPFLTRDQIDHRKFLRIKELIDYAYANVPIYRKLYDDAGVLPRDVQTWEDYSRLPIITKDHLIESFPHGCVDWRNFKAGDLYHTRSSGSTGQVVRLYVNEDAILMDTVQGIRQHALQSGLRYAPNHKVAAVYTCPWWYRKVGDQYPVFFVSSLLDRHELDEALDEVDPDILSCYPSMLNKLSDSIQRLNRLYLIIVHSEQSSSLQRKRWSERFGVPVVDEYSSEEATRIALELPCGHIHVCEDTVHLEIVEPDGARPKPLGQSGLTVVTNLLNKATPILRYNQGDYATFPVEQEPCLVGWTQIKAIEGRQIDSFINMAGREIPSGTVLDITYRWLIESRSDIRDFEVIQRNYREIEVRAAVALASEKDQRLSLGQLSSWFESVLGHPVRVRLEFVDRIHQTSPKRRSIRREFRTNEPRSPSKS